MASDLLARIGTELDARIEELRPRALEYERLHAAAESLGTAQQTPDAPILAKPRAKKVTTKMAFAKKTTTKPAAVKKPAAKRTQRTSRGSTAGALEQAVSGASAAKQPRKARRRVSIGRYEQAVLDALEHGSHTVGELVMVTAMGAKDIRGGVSRLLGDKGIVKVDRGGKTAYALPSAAPKESGAQGQGKSAKG
jgi:hypothetical protein